MHVITAELCGDRILSEYIHIFITSCQSATLLVIIWNGVRQSIGERESKKFVEGLNSKVKSLYKRFGKEVQFKKYLHGLSDAGTRLLFK